MEPKYIKFEGNQVNLPEIYRNSEDHVFNEDDIRKGTLVIGTNVDKTYMCLGFLREITRPVNTVETIFEIVNAVKGEGWKTVVVNPRLVKAGSLPFFAARISTSCFVVGQVVSCNGEKAVVVHYDEADRISVNDIYELTPCSGEAEK